MDCLTLKNHLLPCPHCVIPFLLPLCPSPFPQPISHSPRFIFFTSLLLSPSIFCDTYSLSAPALSFLPSFQKMDCLSVFSLFSPHVASTHTNTHAQNPSVILTFLICNSCRLFLLLPFCVLQEEHKSKACRLSHLRLFMELLQLSFSCCC